ncbi:hypothetical protein KP509_02G002200 [Ceratopteris richardii]|nr:hypothetical protein KP509_02G002200 [Ceratopteris richardii]
MISTNSSVAGYWSPQNASQNLTVINLKSGNNIQAWIDYNGQAQQLNVSIAPVSQPQPHVPLLSVHVNLSNILKDYMYVGFSGSTGVISGTHRVLSWSFSNNGTAEALDLSKLPVLFPSPSFESSTRFKVMVGSIVLASLLVLGSLMGFVLYKRSHREVVESWELEFGLHRYSYKELVVATKNFHEGELLGVGGFGRVYKGMLPKSQLGVAVKRLSSNSDQGEREFIAEMSSMGQLHHQNLVALLGWSRCKGELLLVYEYMPNGSLDKLIFGKSGKVLRWEQRLRIVEGIAAGVLYLHEGWERQILHRDIKASNVLLDADMNAKLGDFGLARLYEHGQNPHTTKVVGTLGYMAPEFARTGKATPSTDVYSFGILLLEVMTARRPFELHGPHHPDFLLVEGLWELYMNEKLLEAADKKLEGLFNPKEMEKILMLGLLCTHPDPSVRPTMQQVLQTLRGHEHLPSLPPFQANLSSSGLIRDVGELISFSSTSIKSWSTADMTTQITGR